MNSVSGLTFGLLTVGFAASCSSNAVDEILVTGDPVAAVFSAKISAPATRASGTNWDKDDQLGIFMLKDGGSLATSGDILADNYLYKVNSLGQVADAGIYLEPVSTDDGGSGAIYMSPGDAYDFVSYYPFKATASLTDGYKYPVSLADQYDQASGSDHDLLYSKSRRKNVRTDDVSFEFSHVLSNITIDVTRGKGIDETLFKAKNVVITGMPTTANFNLADGSSLTDLDDVANIESSKSDTDGESYEVIILPQAASSYSGRTIKFTVSGVDHLWSIPDGFAFESGKRYIYNFTLSSGGLELNGDVKIAAWGDGGTLDPTDSGWGKGNEELLKFETVDIATATFKIGFGTTGNAIAHNVSFKKAAGFKMSKYQITTTQYCHYLNGDRDNITVKKNGSDWEAWGKLPTTGLYGESNYIHVADIIDDEVLLVRSHTWSITYDEVKRVWSPKAGYEKHPINQVTWYGAHAFCLWAGGDCRLPTEAEWEFACRAGSTETTTEANNYGLNASGVQITASTLGTYAWYTDNSGNVTHPVGEKAPNKFDLYDIHGNVWEWCYDWFNATYFTATAVDDPVKITDPSDSPGKRVLRGGAYNYAATGCRSAYRGYGVPAGVGSHCGFRVVFPL